MKQQRKHRNKLRMRERRRDPEYKEKERQRQSELRARRSKSAKTISSRTPLSMEGIPPCSIELNQTQSNQPYAFMKMPEFYSNDVPMDPPVPQLSSPNATVPPFPAQVMPVAVPVLEAESMHEATCIVSIPSVSNKPQLPAVVRMAVMPPVPSIINLVIVPGNGGTDGGAKVHNTLPTQAGNVQLAAQVRSSNTTASQILQLDDPADFFCNSNDMVNGQRKRFKPSEENSTCVVGRATHVSQ